MNDNFVKYLYERGRDPYPRTALRLYPQLKRYDLESWEQFEKFIYLNKDIYCALFSKYQRTEREYDMIFLDIDSHEMHMSYLLLDIVRERLEASGIEHYLINFSGSKGFHVYVPFRPTRLVNFRNAVLEWIRDIGIQDYVDTSAIEPNRVTRIPYTINSKSGLYCVPVGDRATKFTLESALERAKIGQGLNNIHVLMNEDLGFKLKTFDQVTSSSGVLGIVEGARSEMFANEKHYPQCMKRLVAMSKDGVPLNHDERLQMGIFLLHVYGGDVDQVAKYYELFDDYKEHTTKYQLNYAKKRKLKMMGCDNLTDVGICCVEHSQCPFYDSINHFVTKERKEQLATCSI